MLLINVIPVFSGSTGEGASPAPTNNYPPYIYNGSVTPQTGNTSTTFTYSVIYSDLDDNPAQVAHVFIDGKVHDMKFIGGNNTTGAIYQFSTKLTAGSHKYYFNFSDGSNSTLDPWSGHYFGPTVTGTGGSNNTPPRLTSGKVTPYYGDYTMIYTYSVVYMDLDNNTPTVRNVIIDQQSYQMTYVSGLISQGALYEYKTNLSVGQHTYKFNFSDGNSSVDFPAKGVYYGPTVTLNRAPTINNCGVTPTTGTTATVFTFFVNYSDPDGDPAIMKHLYIDSYLVFNMSFVSGNNLSGALYQYKLRLPVGNHTFYFYFSDGKDGDLNPVQSFYWVNVTAVGGGNNIMSLSNGTVTPQYGDQNTIFTYNVTYKDPDNVPPIDKLVYINSVPNIMSFISGNFTTGALYQFTTKLKPHYYYNYHFYFTNINDTVILPHKYLFYGPYVSWSTNNTRPTLSHGHVSPTSGNTSTTFTYRVTYKDAENNTPVYKLVYIDGKPKTMTYISGNNTHGAIYQYKTTLTVGNHTYYFYFSDNISSVRLPHYGAYYGPLVTKHTTPSKNHPPVLFYGFVTPTSGNTSTTFVYQVTYMDYDNDAPVVKNVIINGTAFAMTYISGIYTQGAIYQYSTKLKAGCYNFYFYFTDGKNGTRLPASGVYNGPKVTTGPSGHKNQPPTLYYGTVGPTAGTPNTIFTYRVTYKDPDNDPPVIKRVFIDGKPFTMKYYYGSYSTGAVFTYRTSLTVGQHKFHFYFTDGNASARAPASGSYSGPCVTGTGGTNRPPTLFNGSVSPITGTVNTMFTFSVVYKDLDYDLPKPKHVYIDGSPYNMSFKSGSLSTGAIYQYQTTLGLGNHTYYFYFGDWNATVRLPKSGAFHGPCVKRNGTVNNPPKLFYGFVSPMYANTSTLFTYTVVYKDPDNDAPIVKKVFIDNRGYTMSFVRGNYSTGAHYQYKTKLAAGNHTFYFSFSDGRLFARLPANGTFNGPTVSIPSPNNSPVLYTGSVTPRSGTTSTMFLYSVYYKDLDSDAPTVASVYIDHRPYTMTKISGPYKTGALFHYKTKLGHGSHNFYFSFSDGKAGARLPGTGKYSGPIVTLPPNNPPVADAGPDKTVTVGPKKVVHFDGSGSSDPDHDKLKYFWDFGDGDYEWGMTVSHIFRGVGKYNVTLTVWDGQASDDDNCIVHVKDSGKGKSKGKAKDKPIPGFEGILAIMVLGSAMLFLYRKRRLA
jgi:hypothetical protein